MKTKVINIKKCKKFDVYIGRKCGQYEGSIWGNPYEIGVHGTRSEVIEKYEIYLRNNPQLMCRLEFLRGKVLGCWCKPENCHGNVILKLLKETEETEFFK